MRASLLAAAVAVSGSIAFGARPSSAPGQTAGQPPPQQPSDISTTITGEPGAPPRLAVPPFIALSDDAETVSVAATIGEVLRNDLAFEREFDLIPRDVQATVPPARSFTDVALDRWREVNADGVLVGTVRKTPAGMHVEVRLLNVRTGRQAFGAQYDGSAGRARLFAHTISDEVHEQQRGLRGVARTKLTFNSDRDGERLRGSFESRQVKEIYIADYDGENQRRLTTSRSLNINSSWSPDARAIAYTSYQRGAPNIFISNIYQGTRETLTSGPGESWLPAWSPDGTRLAFSSTRDGSGNAEIYVVNRDGSNVRRLTRHPASDTTPTWSPTGTEIAFTSDRSGSPQIYVVAADGLGGVRRLTSEGYADKPTWSAAPFNEIAYTARTGPGFDVKIMDVATRQVRQLTFGEGSNESPVFSPNGRHLAFMSTRFGKAQILTMARDGRDIRQVTRAGNNYQPDWSN
jgi:TolB protein